MASRPGFRRTTTTTTTTTTTAKAEKPRPDITLRDTTAEGIKVDPRYVSVKAKLAPKETVNPKKVAIRQTEKKKVEAGAYTKGLRRDILEQMPGASKKIASAIAMLPLDAEYLFYDTGKYVFLNKKGTISAFSAEGGIVHLRNNATALKQAMKGDVTLWKAFRASSPAGALLDHFINRDIQDPYEEIKSLKNLSTVLKLKMDNVRAELDSAGNGTRRSKESVRNFLTILQIYSKKVTERLTKLVERKGVKTVTTKSIEERDEKRTKLIEQTKRAFDQHIKTMSGEEKTPGYEDSFIDVLERLPQPSVQSVIASTTEEGFFLLELINPEASQLHDNINFYDTNTILQKQITFPVKTLNYKGDYITDVVSDFNGTLVDYSDRAYGVELYIGYDSFPKFMAKFPAEQAKGSAFSNNTKEIIWSIMGDSFTYLTEDREGVKFGQRTVPYFQNKSLSNLGYIFNSANRWSELSFSSPASARGIWELFTGRRPPRVLLNIWTNFVSTGVYGNNFSPRVSDYYPDLKVEAEVRVYDDEGEQYTTSKRTRRA